MQRLCRFLGKFVLSGTEGVAGGNKPPNIGGHLTVERFGFWVRRVLAVLLCGVSLEQLAAGAGIQRAATGAFRLVGTFAFSAIQVSLMMAALLLQVVGVAWVSRETWRLFRARRLERAHPE
jgi:uncharacterized membrane protein YidH (DUF202 family)